MSHIKPGVIYGLGNPLLDICVPVDFEFLKKYDLQPNNAILADEKHKDLAHDVKKTYSSIKYVAGGSCQNSLRVAQWVLKKYPKSCTMMGCISDDFFGKCMRARAEEDGLKCEYLIDKSVPTGICHVLITDSGKNRTLVADLGAANHFKKDFLINNWSIVENAKICYATGFHLTVSPESELEVAKYCSNQSDKIFAFNLSAPFIMQVFGEHVEKVSPYANLIFGNETEAQAYADLKKWKTNDQTEIAKLIASETRTNENKPRIAILTQGSDPIVVAYGLSKNEKPEEKERVKTFKIEVPLLNKEDIIDTNGAGDGFAGGFLGKLVLNNYDLSEKSVRECIRVGAYCAREIIMQDGLSIPQHEANFVI